MVGLVYLLQLPRDELNHRSFIDENALMTGLVRREFNDANSISHYAEQLEPVYDDRWVWPHRSHLVPEDVSYFRGVLISETTYHSTGKS